MADRDFSNNIIRMLAGELHVSNLMTAAREMFGKSYFSLGDWEKHSVEHAVLAMAATAYHMVTPEFLTEQTAQRPMGFRAQFDPQEET
jgi:hypothetical protein